MKTKTENPVSNKITNSALVGGGDLSDINYVELVAINSRVPVTITSGSDQVNLELGRSFPIESVTSGDSFSVKLDNDLIPELILKLDDEGNLKIMGSDGWTTVLGTPNMFQYGRLDEHSFNIIINLRAATLVDEVDIILVGTVPTDDDRL